MMNIRFQRAARRRRAMAFALTLLFHALLIAGIAYAGDSDLSELLPERVQEWFGWETSQADGSEAATAPVPQP